jgi:hypothetical protein
MQQTGAATDMPGKAPLDFLMAVITNARTCPCLPVSLHLEPFYSAAPLPHSPTAPGT